MRHVLADGLLQVEYLPETECYLLTVKDRSVLVGSRVAARLAELLAAP